MKINELNELSTLNCDIAKEVMLKIVNNNEDITNYKGIYNQSQGRLANVVSKNYQIIQHQDVVDSLRETLQRLNLNIKGQIKHYKDTMDIRVVFKDRNDLIIKDDTHNGIMLGIRVLNSYDKQTSFRLEMFGVRMFCDNGMILGKAINNVRSVTVHLGEIKTKDIIARTTEKFVAEMINSSQKLQRYVSESMEDSVEWDLMLKLLEKLVLTEKHRKALIDQLGEKYLTRNISRWDLYNAFTTYTTHNEQLSPYVETNLQNIAQDVLTISYKELIKQKIEVAQ